jgi:hypothetical protein
MPEIADLATLIAEFLADADSTALYDHDQLRALRANLAHVIASDLGSAEPASIRGRQIDALTRELRDEGVADGRVQAIVAALRLVFAYAVGRGLIKTSPLVGRATTDDRAPSPTTAMLAFGRQAAAWTVRGLVIAFALTVVGLILALA